MKLYRARELPDAFVGEDKAGALLVFPAKPRGWGKRTPYQGSRRTLDEISPSEARGTGWPGAIGGKTRAASGEPSVYQISVRVTAEERELWLAAAGEGRLADWIRSTLTVAARQRTKSKP
ncbi:MAG TPA: hypothetical protein VN253_24920 [Kofleriaceae bacterium]|nr:hypothetical protein [Kofleriaceae bacterium]